MTFSRYSDWLAWCLKDELVPLQAPVGRPGLLVRPGPGRRPALAGLQACQNRFVRSPFLTFLSGPTARERLALRGNLAEILRATLGRCFAALASQGYSMRVLFCHV